ncbi:MAG: cytochrome b/b6 domain-containing protein [Candidatus Eremiobacteraeota bacterium]|nr:cytochrome b/b6 domain-containing protein [Candidatus Eremiobacteraeota bacterium]
MHTDRPAVYRHSVTTRVTHWVFFVAFLALVSSGLQIFNAAPYLDASDKTDPGHRVLSIDSPQDGTGTTTVLGRTFKTTGFLGWADNGMGGRDARAFPGWLTIPAEQSLADGRRWHFFFAWIMVICGIAYIVSSVLRKDFPEIILRPSDFPKMLPMQLYYLKIRPDPPLHGKYNPLQKAAYTLVLFVFAPLIVLSGFALSPGFDALFGPLTAAFGGRQFARLWHFVLMAALIGFALVHVFQVLTQGAYNHLRSMFTGRYRLAKHDGTGI